MILSAEKLVYFPTRSTVYRPIVAAALTLVGVYEAASLPAQQAGRRNDDRTVAAGRGMLIEAEHFSSRQPDDGSFAKTSFDPEASSGRALTKFFPKSGRCTYRFAVQRKGTYDIWLRYAATSSPLLRFQVDAAATPSAAKLPATGGLSGKGNWKWVELASVELDRGEHRISLQGCPIRPDALWISEGVAPPKGEELAARRLRRVRAHLESPIESITPAWIEEAQNYRLPSWYDSTRVSAHTRLSWRWRTRDPERFFHAGGSFASLGFREFVRHIKSGDEAAWWPSRIGSVLPEAQTTNVAERLIAEAHAAGCRIIAYYRHMEDRSIAAEHPEWTARDWQGEIIEKRGPKICFNTPYADFVQTRLVELAKMGVDGFYFDEVHMPKPFCWCDNCRNRFKAATGIDYPKGRDPFDPAYQKAIEFKNVTIERVFRRWRQAIHAVNSEAVLLIGSNSYPQMVERQTTHRLYRIADSMKTEFSLPSRAAANRVFSTDSSLAPTEHDARLALGYAIARDACDGRPPHVWIHGLPNATHARFAAAGVIAHGGIANLDHSEPTIPDARLFRDAVALGNRLAPAFAGMRPMRWALVHYSEYARDHDLPDEPAAWRHVLYPVYGAFTTLFRHHLPVGIITDSQLEQGLSAHTKVLFIPSPKRLTDRMRSAVDRFERAGGRVVYQRPNWRWHERDGGMERAGRGLLSELEPSVGSAPLFVKGGPTRMHSVFFANGDASRLTVALVNDFSWVFTGRRHRRDGRPIPGMEARLNRKPPPPCRGVRVFLRSALRPKEIRELATGRPLEPVAVPGGYRIDVPTFDCVAVLHVRFERTER